MAIEIKRLRVLSEELSLDDLCEAWQLCFIDYGLNVTKTQIFNMLSRRGYLAELSFGAFSDNKMISMTLNCLGRYNGVPSLYDTSTGTAIDFRRKGLAESTILQSIEAAKSVGAQQYILEVLTSNEKAISLYKKLGFEILREYFTFRSALKDLTLTTATVKPLPANIELRELASLPSEEEMSAMWDFTPSWQNSVGSVQRKLLCCCCCF